MDYRLGRCSSCGAEYKIPASFAHDVARCKMCKGVVRLAPARGPSPSAPLPAAARTEGVLGAEPGTERPVARPAPPPKEPVRSPARDPSAPPAGAPRGAPAPRPKTQVPEPAPLAPAAARAAPVRTARKRGLPVGGLVLALVLVGAGVGAYLTFVADDEGAAETPAVPAGAEDGSLRPTDPAAPGTAEPEDAGGTAGEPGSPGNG